MKPIAHKRQYLIISEYQANFEKLATLLIYAHTEQFKNVDLQEWFQMGRKASSNLIQLLRIHGMVTRVGFSYGTADYKIVRDPLYHTSPDMEEKVKLMYERFSLHQSFEFSDIMDRLYISQTMSSYLTSYMVRTKRLEIIVHGRGQIRTVWKLII